MPHQIAGAYRSPFFIAVIIDKGILRCCGGRKEWISRRDNGRVVTGFTALCGEFDEDEVK